MLAERNFLSSFLVLPYKNKISVGKVFARSYGRLDETGEETRQPGKAEPEARFREDTERSRRDCCGEQLVALGSM